MHHLCLFYLACLKCIGERKFDISIRQLVYRVQRAILLQFSSKWEKEADEINVSFEFGS